MPSIHQWLGSKQLSRLTNLVELSIQMSQVADMPPADMLPPVPLLTPAPCVDERRAHCADTTSPREGQGVWVALEYM